MHTRLMLFASTSLIGPAFGRIAEWTVFGGVGPLINAMPVLFIVAIVGYDINVRKRIHFVTAVAGSARLASLAVAAALENSEFGQSFVRSLR